MNISVILGHPNPGSFNHALAQAAVSALERLGYTVRFHDLSAENFNPLLPIPELTSGPVPEQIRLHCEEIAAADGIVIVHPNWWGQPPAILKGWVDRVLRMGVAYRFGLNDKGEGVPIGLLRAKAALVLNTSNTPADREAAVFGDPLDNLWKTCIFDFCGVRNVARHTYSVVVTSTPEERAAWLKHAEELVTSTFAIL